MTLFYKFLFFLILCPFALNGERLRIATYNLRNYLSMDRLVEGIWCKDYPKPELEKRALRSIICQARPDVLLLQEIGSLAHLLELQSDLRHDGIDYPHAYHLLAEDSQRQIAVLSQIEPAAIGYHSNLSFRYHGEKCHLLRGLLELVFELKGLAPFSVFNLHLKSRWTVDANDPQAQKFRAAEAQAARNRMLAQTVALGRSNYIVAGDFNDHPRSACIRRFLKKGERTIGHLITALDGRRERWTYYFDREVNYQMVDGLIVSPDLFPRVTGGLGTIVDHPEALVASDHRMVFLDLYLGAPQPIDHDADPSH